MVNKKEITKDRITITIDKDVLSKIDSCVGGNILINRSVAINLGLRASLDLIKQASKMKLDITKLTTYQVEDFIKIYLKEIQKIPKLENKPKGVKK